MLIILFYDITTLLCPISFRNTSLQTTVLQTTTANSIVSMTCKYFVEG